MTAPKALREMCERILNNAPRSRSYETELARALLDRLSGEAVTREKIVRELISGTHENMRLGEYEELADAVLSLLPAGMDTGWLPIESAPKDGTPFLGFDPTRADDESPVQIIAWLTPPKQDVKKPGWHVAWDHDDQYDGHLTHWRPLPKSPT